MGTLSQRFAEFSEGLRYPDLPGDVTAYAKLLMLDLFGAALAARDTPERSAALAGCKALAPILDDGAALWGTGLRTTPGAAALFNGILAHTLELDDFNGVDHSGAVVVPALLAAAATRPDMDGERAIEGMVVGYEIGRRVLEAAGGYRQHNSTGWHTTGTCGSFAAAAATAKALKLDAGATANALGLAGSFTGGLWAFIADGSMSKRYHAGRAAETGIVAATLASNGLTGPAEIFEASWGGYFSTYAPGFPAEPLLDGLGEGFRLSKAGVKPYACCRGIHSSVDAILELRTQRGDPDRLSAVEIVCTPGQIAQLGRVRPSTRLQAQFSLSYSVAVAMVTGKATLAEFVEPWLSDAAVEEVERKVRLIEATDLPLGWEPRLTLRFADGHTSTAQVAEARGGPSNPLSETEIREKYRGLAEPVLGTDTARTLEETVMSLEKSGNLGRTIALLGRAT